MHRAFNDLPIVIVTHYSGLTVAEMTELRRRLREVGGAFKVSKNRLVLRALEGTPYQALAPLFRGPTAIAYAEDPVAVAKALVEFARAKKKLDILGGGMGARVLGGEEVRALATLPSLDELRGRLIGLINAPATKIAAVLQAPAGQLARVLAARGEQQEAA